MNTYAVVEDERVEKQLTETATKTVPRSVAVACQQPLFQDVLLESSGGQRKRRTWATLLSFFLEAILLGVLALIPLWFTDVLPKQQLLTFLEAPPPPPPPPPAAPATTAVRVVKITSDIASAQLRTPGRIPTKVHLIKEEDAPPPEAISGGVVGGVPGGIPGGQLGGVIGGIISSSSNVAAVPDLSKRVPQRVRVSQGVSKGLLIYRIEPTYPPVARAAHIQGVVVLAAIIDKDGNIQNLQVVSGHPMLAPAAIDAVKQGATNHFFSTGNRSRLRLRSALRFSCEVNHKEGSYFMLRITVQENGQVARFRLEGKLKGDWVRELERCWIQARNEHPEMQFLAELGHVDYVDDDGRKLLSRMVSQRTMLEAHNNLMSASLVDEIMHSPTHLKE